MKNKPLTDVESAPPVYFLAKEARTRARTEICKDTRFTPGIPVIILIKINDSDLSINSSLYFAQYYFDIFCHSYQGCPQRREGRAGRGGLLKKCPQSK